MMNLKKKNNWYTWALGIATSVIGSFIYDYWRAKPILSTLADIFNTIWNLIASILNYELKIWWLIIAFILFIGIIYLIQKFKAEAITEPKFIKYKEDRFKEWKWTWDWKWNEIKKSWMIVDLQAYCPRCGTTLLDNSTFLDTIYECPRGDFRTGRFEDQAEDKRHIEALIIDKAKREI